MPLSGEISLGGLIGQPEKTGVRFGKFYPIYIVADDRVYTAEAILKHYTDMTSKTEDGRLLTLDKDTLLDDVKHKYNDIITGTIYDISPLTVIMSKLTLFKYDFSCKGVFNNSNESFTTSILNACAYAIQKRYFIVLIGKYLTMHKQCKTGQAEDSLKEDLGGEKLISHIKHYKINFKEIYENPSPDNIDRVVSFLNSCSNIERCQVRTKDSISEYYFSSKKGEILMNTEATTKEIYQTISLCQMLNSSPLIIQSFIRC